MCRGAEDSGRMSESGTAEIERERQSTVAAKVQRPPAPLSQRRPVLFCFFHWGGGWSMVRGGSGGGGHDPVTRHSV